MLLDAKFLFELYEIFCRSFVLTKHEKSHIVSQELAQIQENPLDIEFVDSDNVEVQEVDFEDEESVKQATDLLLQKELGEEVIEGEVEQEIIQDEHDFKVIEPQDIVSEEDASMVYYTDVKLSYED